MRHFSAHVMIFYHSAQLWISILSILPSSSALRTICPTRWKTCPDSPFKALPSPWQIGRWHCFWMFFGLEKVYSLTTHSLTGKRFPLSWRLLKDVENGEKAQSITSLPHKHEDLSSDPETCVKSQQNWERAMRWVELRRLASPSS